MTRDQGQTPVAALLLTEGQVIHLVVSETGPGELLSRISFELGRIIGHLDLGDADASLKNHLSFHSQWHDFTRRNRLEAFHHSFDGAIEDLSTLSLENVVALASGQFELEALNDFGFEGLG